MEIIKKDDINTIAEIENTRTMCELLMKTPHYAKMGMDGIYAIVAKARSLGMDPVDALNGGLYFVRGRVGMSTEAMAARMRAAGHSIQKDPKSNNTICILNGRRSDNGDTWTTSFSIDDAKRAGIYDEKGSWGKYPGVMCYNRAMSMMFRQMTPDLSKGVGYGLDELKEMTSTEVIQEVPQEPSIISQEQVDELKLLFSECDPDFVSKVWATLSRANSNVSDLTQLPASLFDRVKKAAEKNRAEYQSILIQNVEREEIAS